MPEVPDDSVAELEPMLSEHGIENGVKRDDLSVSLFNDYVSS